MIKYNNLNEITYNKLHENIEVANIHIAKIKKRGGIVKQTANSGKILLEYSFPKTKTFIGYRNIRSSEKGKYGTFYNVKKPKHYQSKEVELTFKNPLIVTDKNVYNFEGLSLEYLFWLWFPNLENSYLTIAKKQGIESGELIDKLVTKEAIRKGYDGIVMGDLEIIDLSTHDEF
jgi:hypothetical protein